MKILLDTCTFLWAASSPDLLSFAASEAFETPEAEIYLSLVSIWEILLKCTAKKLDLSESPEKWIRTNREKLRLIPLSLEETALFQEPRLPPVHTDPFDRALICQAIANGLTILTPDAFIHRYPVQALW